MKVIIEMRQELRESFKENKSEILKLRDEMKKREKEWMEERQKLWEKIENMEIKMETQEKEKKKNNIVIRGLEVRAEENLENKVEEFLSKEVKVNVKLIEAYKIGRHEGKQPIIAKVQSWKQKADVMSNKRNLKGKKIYIDNDLTVKEMIIQKKIREVANEEVKMGSKVRIGYQKVIINNKLYEWNAKADKLCFKHEQATKN